MGRKHLRQLLNLWRRRPRLPCVPSVLQPKHTGESRSSSGVTLTNTALDSGGGSARLFEHPPYQHQLAEVIRVVIRDQQRFAEQCLAIAPGEGLE
jgi:hypothetical protein